MIEFDFELRYFEEIEDDIETAKLWYSEQIPNTNLEERFAEAIKETIKKLQKNPFIYYPIFQNIRTAHPKFFPYGVHFIIINCILNVKQCSWLNYNFIFHFIV